MEHKGINRKIKSSDVQLLKLIQNWNEMDFPMYFEPINTFDVPGYLLNNLDHAMEIINEFDNSRLKIMFDCYHIQKMHGFLSENLSKHMDQIGHVQIAAVPNRNEPLFGEINYKYIISLLEKINYKGIKYFENTDYKNNNILNSIFYAEDFINGNIIISYSDILFDSTVVKRLLKSNHDISVVVDIDWRGYYVGRKDHPISEAENVIFNSNNEVEKIGKINTGNEEVHGEFIGMIKLSNRGTEIFKQHFNRLKKIYWNKPFQRAKIFQKAYLTDFIQELVDIGIKVHCVIIESGWKEIDTVEDYQKALKEFNE